MAAAIETEPSWRRLNCRRSVRVLAVVGCVLSAAASGSSQEPPDANAAVRLQTTTTGIGRFAPGKWGVRGAEVFNNSNEPAQVSADVAVDGDPLMEYGRQIWLPPHSRRRVAIPVLPAADATDPLRVHTELAEDAASDEAPSPETLARAQPPLTVFLADADALDAGTLSDTREMVVAMRLAGGNTRNLSELSVEDVPSFVLALDAAEEVVLAGNQLANSPAALETLGVWLQRGGKLWIPLDSIDLRTVELLLSDVVQITLVDRVRFAQFNVQNVAKGLPAGPSIAREKPIEMARVVAPGVNMIHTVDGWPASFWVPVGDGQVLFTTLSPRAWMRPRLPHEQVDQLERNSAFTAETGLDELATYMATPLNPPPLTAADFADYLSGDVGLQVPARGTILTVFVLFWTVWLALGVWLLRKARLERLAIAGPGLAFLAAAPLAVLGHQMRSAAPPTAAVAELVRGGAGVSMLHSTGAATLFVPSTTETQITASQGRMIVPTRDRLDGKRRTLDSTDLNDWQWSSLTLPTGVQGAVTERHDVLASPLRATANFGPDGLTGRLQTSTYVEPTDPIIAAASSQSLAVRLNADGTFAAGTNDVLEPGSYFSGALLTDQQRRRTAVYDRLLQSTRGVRFPQQPTLLAWARPAETGLQFAEQMQQSATSLLAIPVEFSATPSGTDVTIPAPLMTYDVVGTDGLPPTIYDPRLGRWQKSSAAADVVVRFHVPESVLPVVPRSATLTIKVRAPWRTVELSAGTPEQSSPVASLTSPEGPVSTLAISDPAALAVGADGILPIRLRVTELQAENADPSALKDVDRSWQMESFGLEFSGRTADREGEARE